MTLGFAFSGCSGRLCFHLGAAQRLQQAGIHAQITTGSSSGSLVAAATALNRLELVDSTWRSVLGECRLVQPRRLLQGHWPVAMTSILRHVLNQWFGDTRMQSVPIPLGITVTTIGLRGRRSRLIQNSDDLTVAHAIAASSFIPGIYSRMVPIGNRLTFDGAWLKRTPVSEAQALGSTRVIAFVANPRGALLAGTRGNRQLPIPDYVKVLHPAAELPVQGFDFNPSRIETTFRLGKAAAETFLRQNEKWLADTATPHTP